MKIAFWSNSRGQAGVTTNLAVVSILRALRGESSAIVLENHFNLNNLENIFLNKSYVEGMVCDKQNYIFHMGLEYLMRNIYSTQEKKSLIQRAAIPILDSRILYLPQSPIVNREVFSYEFSQVMYQMFQCLEEVGDHIFIDTEVNDNLSSKLILEEADLVVVNLNQNPRFVEDFFRNYSSLRSKCVFVIGNYRENSRYDVEKIRAQYRIPKSRIGVIPFDMNMGDAIAEGRLIGFLSRSCCTRKRKDTFSRALHGTVDMIEKHIHIAT